MSMPACDSAFLKESLRKQQKNHPNVFPHVLVASLHTVRCQPLKNEVYSENVILITQRDQLMTVKFNRSIHVLTQRVESPSDTWC